MKSSDALDKEASEIIADPCMRKDALKRLFSILSKSFQK